MKFSAKLSVKFQANLITTQQLKVIKGGTGGCELAVEKLETVITS